MKRIAILYGMENTFPAALVDRINAGRDSGVTADHLKVGHIKIGQKSGYAVIIDRISHDIPFYRAYLKNAVLEGATVINNPFWWSADDKFFNYALAEKLGVAVPPTVILPHYTHPPGTTAQSMRNLIYPIAWEEVFEYIGFPAFLKPFLGGGWRNVYMVRSPEQFFEAYHRTGDLGMCLQRAVQFQQYYRCYVVGREKVHVMPYDPRQPHERRYVQDERTIETALYERMLEDARKLCRALGYDLNTVEFAVEDGVPYAIDFMNPAPDADYHSVGRRNFEWVVNAVAEMAVKRAQEPAPQMNQLHWSSFLNAAPAAAGG